MAPDDHDTPGTEVDASAPTAAAGSDAGDAPIGLTRYRLGTILGRGGMGEVLSAHDDQIGRSVAIKRMRAAVPSADAIARFLREAQIQGRLEHPAIVPVHELSRDAGGAPFFVMKQLSGVTLAEVLERLAAGDAKTLAEFTRQRLLRAFGEVCLAVEFAHTRGIVHRDLKPANIVMGDFGEVYVLDWGIAKVADESRAAFGDVDTLDDGATIEGSILGTPGYMPPEQIEGAADLDGRADVYALGCILFEILTLEPLHARGHAGLASALAGIDAHPSRRKPDADLAPELDAACVTATALARVDRYARPRTLGDAVQRFLDGDRDLVLRTQLAHTALDRAREALAADATDEQGVAMKAAGRALALDPKGGAAELVAKLMLEPPRETPADVDRTLALQDHTRKLDSRRLMSMGGCLYLVFLPLLAWSGFGGVEILALAAVSIAMVAIGLLATPRTLALMTSLSVVVHGVAIMLASRYGSPFLFAAPLAVITATAMAMQSVARPTILVAWFSLAMLAPWIGEQLGWWSSTISIAGRTVVLTTAARNINPVAALVTLSVFLVVVVIMSVVFANIMRNQRRAAQRTTEIQAWRLRQLVTG